MALHVFTHMANEFRDTFDQRAVILAPVAAELLMRDPVFAFSADDQLYHCHPHVEHFRSADGAWRAALAAWERVFADIDAAAVPLDGNCRRLSPRVLPRPESASAHFIGGLELQP